MCSHIDLQLIAKVSTSLFGQSQIDTIYQLQTSKYTIQECAYMINDLKGQYHSLGIWGKKDNEKSKKSIEVGLEPTTSGSEVQRAIHCATRPDLFGSLLFWLKITDLDSSAFTKDGPLFEGQASTWLCTGMTSRIYITGRQRKWAIEHAQLSSCFK